jgi:hypothetical protein
MVRIVFGENDMKQNACNKLAAAMLVILGTPFSIGVVIAGEQITDIQDRNIQARVDEAKAVSGDFLKQLGGTMKREMKAGGPTAAIKVCREVAPSIANDISLKKGWKVTRVGTRVRNPMIGTPDAWEQNVLRVFQERIDKGEKPGDMMHYEIVQEPDGRSLRYMKAIELAPQCITCHGSPEQIPKAISEQLHAMYPHDRAVGYKVGELRGAVSIKQPLDN